MAYFALSSVIICYHGLQNKVRASKCRGPFLMPKRRSR
nr:MAG TPA: hypothetical protein [Caudoviricetes sp.]